MSNHALSSSSPSSSSSHPSESIQLAQVYSHAIDSAHGYLWEQQDINNNQQKGTDNGDIDHFVVSIAPLANIDDDEDGDGRSDFDDDGARVKLLADSATIADSNVVYMSESLNSIREGQEVIRRNCLMNNGDFINDHTLNNISNGNILHRPQQQPANNFMVCLNQRLFGGRLWNVTSNGNGSDCKKSKKIELLWRNLSYNVAQFKWDKFLKRPYLVNSSYTYSRLLDSVSGSFRSGELVAIMGPSGAGKTTLIECISGRRKIGVTGEIVVSGGGKRTKLAYNSQDDSLMPCLTVYETLLLASKLRNYQRNNRIKVKLVNDNENVYNATTYPDSDLIIR